MSTIKDCNGREFIHGVHDVKYIIDGDTADCAEVIEAFGQEYLAVKNDESSAHMILYTGAMCERSLEFVERKETVQDIRDEIIDLEQHSFPAITYCRNHVLGTKDGADIAAMGHIIDRVVKAMED